MSKDLIDFYNLSSSLLSFLPSLFCSSSYYLSNFLLMRNYAAISDYFSSDVSLALALRSMFLYLQAWTLTLSLRDQNLSSREQASSLILSLQEIQSLSDSLLLYSLTLLIYQKCLIKNSRFQLPADLRFHLGFSGCRWPGIFQIIQKIVPILINTQPFVSASPLLRYMLQQSKSTEFQIHAQDQQFGCKEVGLNQSMCQLNDLPVSCYIACCQKQNFYAQVQKTQVYFSATTVIAWRPEFTCNYCFEKWYVLADLSSVSQLWH